MQRKLSRKASYIVGECRNTRCFAWLPVECTDRDGSLYKVWLEFYTVEDVLSEDKGLKLWKHVANRRHVEFNK
jgi:hypothetical protein